MDRYVIRDMIVPLLIGTVAVTLMFQINLVIEVYRKYGTEVMTPIAILRLLYYKTPYFLGQTLPIGVALAAALTVARFARESELTAIRSAGVSIARFIRPILFLGSLLAVGNWAIIEHIQPPAELKAADLYNQYNLASKRSIKADVVIQIREFLASFAQISLQPDGSVLLNDAVLISRSPPAKMRIVTAYRGVYRGETWTFEGATERVMVADKLTVFKGLPSIALKQKVQVADLFAEPSVTQQTVAMLRGAISDAKRLQRDSTILEIAYFSRFSVPAACLVFALTGAAFAIWSSKSGPFVGLLISLLVVMLYFNAYVISTQIIGPSRLVSPWLSAWLPDILFFLAGLIALRKIE